MGSRKNVPESKAEISAHEGNKYLLNVHVVFYTALCSVLCMSVGLIAVFFLSPVGSSDVYVADTSPSQHSVALYVILPIGQYMTYTHSI